MRPPARGLRRAGNGATAALLICILCVGGVAAWREARAADRLMRDLMLTEARMIAATLDPGRVAGLSGSERDLASPDYTYLRAQLTRVKAQNAQYRYLYLMGRGPAHKPFFFMGTAPDDSPDYSPPGQVYFEDAPTLERVFDTSVGAVSEPTTDRWGTWISALVPVSSPETGDLMAVFGMDFDARGWRQFVVGRAVAPIGLTLLAALLVATLAVLQRSRQAERERDLAEGAAAELQRFFDVTPDMLGIADASGRFLRANRAWEQALELAPGALVGQLVSDIAGPEERHLLAGTLGQGDAPLVVTRCPTAGGACRFLEWRSQAYDDLTYLAARDVTDEVHALEALRASEESLRTTLNSIADAVVATDGAGRVRGMNPVFSALTGWPDAEAVGVPLCEVLRLKRTGSDEPVDPAREAIESGEAGSADTVSALVARDGQARTVSWRAAPTRDGAGELVGAVVALRDVTEQRRLEEQLRHQQRLDSVGTLAGGLAHDFNNLLQVILGHTSLALDSGKMDLVTSAHIEQVRGAGQRAATLVSQLLAFSRRQTLHPEDLSLNDVVGDLLKMVSRVLGADIRLEFTPGHHLGTVRADRGMLEQVLMNLCLNARDAMPDGGALVIETENVVVDQDYCVLHPWARTGRFVLLTVTDTGCGMDRVTLERVFEPFFTTKEAGRGTGLGLAMVYGIVKQHEGMIQAYSEPGRGSAFKIYLPLVERSAAAVGPKVETPAVGGSETILLAEDDLMVLDLSRTVLELAGYTVVSASSGEEAVARFEEHRDEVALLLLDVVMPGLGGREAYRRIEALRPGVPVIYTSGYSGGGLQTDFVLAEGVVLLQKPFARNDMLRAVRRALDGDTAREPGARPETTAP